MKVPQDIPLMINMKREKGKQRKKFWNDFFKKYVQKSMDSSSEDISTVGSKKRRSIDTISKRNSSVTNNKSSSGRTIYKNKKFVTDDSNTPKTNLNKNNKLAKFTKTLNKRKNSINETTKKKNLMPTLVPDCSKINVDDKENRLEFLLRQRYQSVVTRQSRSFKFWDHAVDKELYKLNENISWAKIKGMVVDIAKKIQREIK